jgi:hypothetical protein
MTDYAAEIQSMIDSLVNPRYATQEEPSVAPILFDGVLQNRAVIFCANSRDPHDYGVAVWQAAQAGEYGPIAGYSPISDVTPPIPYDPADLPPPANPQPTGWTIGAPTVGEAFFSKCVAQVVSSPAQAVTLERIVALLNRNGGKVPKGAQGTQFAALAKAWDMTPDKLAALAVALDDLRFACLAADAAPSQQLQHMKAALDDYNAVSPKKIEVPK